MWTPPLNPNAQLILHSAVKDTHDKNFEIALAKFLWFHENAIQLNRELSGVRRSFALRYWLDLAEIYAPAREAYLKMRNKAEVEYLDDISKVALFRDIVSMNQHIGESIRTANIFEYVAKCNHSVAVLIYASAERSLITSNRYLLCALSLNVKERLERAQNTYMARLEFETDHAAPRVAERLFISDVCDLVALLILNERNEDASIACAAAIAILDNESIRTALQHAMKGQFQGSTG